MAGGPSDRPETRQSSQSRDSNEQIAMDQTVIMERQNEAITQLSQVSHELNTRITEIQSSAAAAFAAIPPGVQKNDLEILAKQLQQSTFKFDTYTPALHYKWANDQEARLLQRDESLHKLLVDPDWTIADADAQPHPAIRWNHQNSPECSDSKQLYLMLHISLPLNLQSKVRLALDDICRQRGDDLLQYSAYHAWRVILQRDENLVSFHLTRLKSAKCNSMADYESHLSQIKALMSDYLGALPLDQHAARQHDLAMIIESNLPPQMRAAIDQQLFMTPIGSRTQHDVLRIANLAYTQWLSRGGTPSKTPPPPQATPSGSKRSTAEQAHALVVSDPALPMPSVHAQPWYDAPEFPDDTAYEVSAMPDEEANWTSWYQPQYRRQSWQQPAYKGKGKGKPWQSQPRAWSSPPARKGFGKGKKGKQKGFGKGKKPDLVWCNRCWKYTGHTTPNCRRRCWQPPCLGMWEPGEHDPNCEDAKGKRDTANSADVDMCVDDYSAEADAYAYSAEDYNYPYEDQADYEHAYSASFVPTTPEPVLDHNCTEHGVGSTPANYLASPVRARPQQKSFLRSIPNPLQSGGLMYVFALISHMLGMPNVPIPTSFRRSPKRIARDHARTSPGSGLPSPPAGWQWTSAIIDSGSSVDTFANPSTLPHSRPSARTVQVANGQRIQIQAEGIAELHTCDEHHRPCCITIPGAVSDTRLKSLISFGKLQRRGMTVVTESDPHLVTQAGTRVPLRRDGDLQA